MPVKHIASRDNAQFRSWLALAEDRQVRRARNQTVLDGAHLIEEANRAGIAPVQIILDADSGDPEPWCQRYPDVSVSVLGHTLFKRLTPVATPTGVLAVIDIPRPARLLEQACVVMIEDVQDPGNLGALIRTAAAAGVADLLLSRGCAEAWSPKTLRGGQGGHFRVALHEGIDLVEAARRHPGPVYAAALRQSTSLYSLDLSGYPAFLFGNEGAGLSAAVLAEATPFSIPMPGAIESLNVVTAAAVCLFERVRQREVAR